VPGKPASSAGRINVRKKMAVVRLCFAASVLTARVLVFAVAVRVRHVRTALPCWPVTTLFRSLKGGSPFQISGD